MLHKNIDRLEAQADYRQLSNLISATSTEGVKARQEQLLKTIGKIYVVERRSEGPTVLNIEEEQLDRAGLNRLRGTGRLR